MRARLPLLFALAALLVLAAMVSWGTSGIPTKPPSSSDVDLTNELYTPGPVTMITDPPPGGSDIIDALLTLVLVLVLVAFVLVAISGLRLLRNRRRERSRVGVYGPSGEAGWLSEVTKDAVSAMDRHVGGPPSDAVIAAWVHLETEAAASGTEREPHQTPSEFTEAVLTEHHADENALRDLKSVYQRARFGQADRVTADDVAVARAALERIALEAK
ncbi:DUF4129 domain-containing protein [Actinocrispum sp. NPDC049592]|uniref:DUF4129 domain-containing protein n=1 Tax=Actinocrispum sp. NPDC049592 TaxID=3154835 RepID=UPI00342EAF85